MTAVINLVTQSGKDINGASVSGGAGNYGQQKLSFVYGKAFAEENELLIWGTHYRADGETVEIPKEKDYSKFPKDSSAILDGFKDLPSYDVGVKYRFGHFTLLGNTRYSKYIEPFSGGGKTNGESYNYDEYPQLYGMGPGLGSRFTHFGLTYDDTFSNDWTAHVHGYYDQSLTQGYLVTDPSGGGFRANHWSDRDWGIVTQFQKTYNLENLGNGNILLGTQLEKMEVYETQFFKGSREEPSLELGSDLELGKESIYSGFFQLKHRFSEKWILNLGLRYDNKDRHKGKNVANFSPRLALIYLPNKKFEAKVSYARSFVDAPYFYRYNDVPAYKGQENLNPEHLRSFQVTPTLNLVGGRFKNGLNFFYNDLPDFIWRLGDVPGGEANYVNGSIQSWGIEDEVSFIQNAYSIRANLTYQKVVKDLPQFTTGERIHNVPKWTRNVIFDVNPFYATAKNIGFNFTARYIGKQLSPIDITFRDKNEQVIRKFQEPDRQVDAALIFNVGFSLHQFLPDGFSLTANVYNILDTKYYQGGSVKHPYPQPGRWFLVQMTYNLN
ncbi:TonB-dependent receptor [Candidatus Poribacteria bacterium]|nr:TonB-dependent receptor [Candidatus Poribacteria bacterium]